MNFVSLFFYTSLFLFFIQASSFFYTSLSGSSLYKFLRQNCMTCINFIKSRLAGHKIPFS